MFTNVRDHVKNDPGLIIQSVKSSKYDYYIHVQWNIQGTPSNSTMYEKNKKTFHHITIISCLKNKKKILM